MSKEQKEAAETLFAEVSEPAGFGAVGMTLSWVSKAESPDSWQQRTAFKHIGEKYVFS